ncbi:MAG: hypothetical protein IID46_12215, partial [Planctomycetes bacterium]|nr:hypothetical protein [Planctomycetota bacterium]
TEVAEADGDDANKGKKRGGKKGAKQTAQRSSTQVNLAWLPDDTELIVSFRVADLWNSPLVQSLIDNPEVQRGIAKMQESIGLEPGDIESVTFGGSRIFEVAKSLSQARMAGKSPNAFELLKLLVIRTSKPVDIQKILSLTDESVADKIEKAQHNGKEYYRGLGVNPNKKRTVGMYVADAKTIVIGLEESVKTAIDSNGRAGDSSRFAFADAGQHLLIAFVPSDLSAFYEDLAANPLEDSSPAKKLSEALKGKLRGVAFGLTLNEGLSLQFDTNMQDSQAAKKVSTALSDIVQEGLDSLAEAESAVPPNFKKYITIATKILENATTSTNNTVAQLDLAIPPSSLLTLKGLPEDIMPAMLFGGLPGFGPTGGNSGTVVVPSVEKKPMILSPAKFPGHDTPISLEFVKITGEENFREVQFKAINHSDKGIESFEMTLVFLDAGGKKLKDFPSSYSSPTQFGPDGQQTREPAVKKKATKQFEVTAFFMPEETKSVRADLRSVRFVDAETWEDESN